MSEKSLDDIAKAMRDIDITILSTISETGAICGRPMSNNRDVDFDGNSYYFTSSEGEIATQIAANPQVGLGLQGHHGLYIAVTGHAALIRDKAAFSEHWTKSLDKWFEHGIETPGLVLVHVKADSVQFWDGRDSGEFNGPQPHPSNPHFKWTFF
jgi:general stress protein 26